jgi:uncharacterized DUF497 family protein
VLSWDTPQAVANLAQRSFWFEEAATVFSDPDALDWADPEHSNRELHSKRLGASSKSCILMVVCTARKVNYDKESIRIISARQASRKDRAA